MPSTRGEPVEVWLRDGRPVSFVWRGRMYTVIFVLDRRSTPRAGPGSPAGMVNPAAPAGPARPADPEDSGSPAESGSQQRGDRECWLVEATPLRAVPPATYELCHEAAADRWTLTRS